MPNNKPKSRRQGSQPPQMLSRSLASDRARWITGATIPVDGRSKLRAQEMTMKSHRITAKLLSERRRRNSKASNYMPLMAT